MNGIQTKRAVYYGLLIVCLAAALLTMFLPFAYCWTKRNTYYSQASVDYSLAPVSTLYCLTRSLTYDLLGWYSHFSDLFDQLFRVFALVTAFLLGLSLLRVLRSLNDEVNSFEAVPLGKGPVVGICFFALLLVLGILNQSYLGKHLVHTVWILPIWPLAGLLLNCASLGLARKLNP